MNLESRFIAADFHTHNSFSLKDSFAQPEDVVIRCQRQGIGCIAVTNHNTIDGAAQTKDAAQRLGIPLMVITGEEITTSDSNPAGKRVEVLAFFLQEAIPPNLSIDQTLKKIKSQDAIVGIPHPFELWRHGAGREIAVEIIKRAKEIGIPILWEVFNSRSSSGSNCKAKDFLKTHGDLVENHVLIMVGSDAHHPGEVGRARLHLGKWGTKEEFLQKLPTSKRLTGACEGYNEPYVTLFYRTLNRISLLRQNSKKA